MADSSEATVADMSRPDTDLENFHPIGAFYYHHKPDADGVPVMWRACKLETFALVQLAQPRKFTKDDPWQ
jgi:hypothetical protein